MIILDATNLYPELKKTQANLVLYVIPNLTKRGVENISAEYFKGEYELLGPVEDDLNPGRYIIGMIARHKLDSREYLKW